MTKLEQKLLQLGYELDYEDEIGTIYTKKMSFFEKLVITIIKNYNPTGYVWTETRAYCKQDYIDNLQQAFNQLQNDLKELKEYE